MMTDRKKPGVTFWTAVVVVVVLVAYPLSWGPVCWLDRKGVLPSRTANFAYRPLGYLSECLPPRAERVVMDYLMWWVDLGD